MEDFNPTILYKCLDNAIRILQKRERVEAHPEIVYDALVHLERALPSNNKVIDRTKAKILEICDQSFGIAVESILVNTAGAYWYRIGFVAQRLKCSVQSSSTGHVSTRLFLFGLLGICKCTETADHVYTEWLLTNTIGLFDSNDSVVSTFLKKPISSYKSFISTLAYRLQTDRKLPKILLDLVLNPLNASYLAYTAGALVSLAQQVAAEDLRVSHVPYCFAYYLMLLTYDDLEPRSRRKLSHLQLPVWYGLACLLIENSTEFEFFLRKSHSLENTFSYQAAELKSHIYHNRNHQIIYPQIVRLTQLIGQSAENEEFYCSESLNLIKSATTIITRAECCEVLSILAIDQIIPLNIYILNYCMLMYFEAFSSINNITESHVGTLLDLFAAIYRGTYRNILKPSTITKCREILLVCALRERHDQNYQIARMLYAAYCLSFKGLLHVPDLRDVVCARIEMAIENNKIDHARSIALEYENLLLSHSQSQALYMNLVCRINDGLMALRAYEYMLLTIQDCCIERFLEIFNDAVKYQSDEVAMLTLERTVNILLLDDRCSGNFLPYAYALTTMLLQSCKVKSFVSVPMSSKQLMRAFRILVQKLALHAHKYDTSFLFSKAMGNVVEAALQAIPFSFSFAKYLTIELIWNLRFHIDSVFIDDSFLMEAMNYSAFQLKTLQEFMELETCSNNLNCNALLRLNAQLTRKNNLLTASSYMSNKQVTATVMEMSHFLTAVEIEGLLRIQSWKKAKTRISSFIESVHVNTIYMDFMLSVLLVYPVPLELNEMVLSSVVRSHYMQKFSDLSSLDGLVIHVISQSSAGGIKQLRSTYDNAIEHYLRECVRLLDKYRAEHTTIMLWNTAIEVLNPFGVLHEAQMFFTNLVALSKDISPDLHARISQKLRLLTSRLIELNSKVPFGQFKRFAFAYAKKQECRAMHDQNRHPIPRKGLMKLNGSKSQVIILDTLAGIPIPQPSHDIEYLHQSHIPISVLEHQFSTNTYNETTSESRLEQFIAVSFKKRRDSFLPEVETVNVPVSDLEALTDNSELTFTKKTSENLGFCFSSVDEGRRLSEGAVAETTSTIKPIPDITVTYYD
ncbi:hypothetical protein CANCADRAFT_30923 [Tortispora caseinolytica NRRL Y-17796]|uniref:Uncharacterized protein n=1 Tax=Tortispora caseinolytica NRRL Y-17796 TaxID=767744 RepID=A0A1E4TME2_9ASCO|nr:hypothetical protein CANCADRAFT_30923 [Tortispora caseinolytica NRRL Y-17796]